MIKNIFLVAWRTIRKNRLYTFANITGLTIGITSCILIGTYIVHELSFDRFNSNADRIARVVMEYSIGGTKEMVATTGTKVGPQFRRTFPAVEAFARVLKFPAIITYGDKVFDEKKVLYADSSFFRIFSFRLLKGNPALALREPNQIVISQSMAKKYFGQEDPMGKTLRISNDQNFSVSGVVEDCPDNSQLQYDFVASFLSWDPSSKEEWWTANYITYLLLHGKGQLEQLQKQVTAYMNTAQVRKEAEMKGGDYLTYHLEPLKRVHLYSSQDGLEPNGNITYIFILGAIALLILLIACVNYTNLATAQSAGRSAEIGIRKVMGAKPGELFAQYLGESGLLTFISLLLAVVASLVLLPLFNKLSGKALSPYILTHPLALSMLLGLGLFVSLLAGAYPAFILSKIKLISILKSGFSFSSSGNGLRKSLIVFQFLISVFLMISTFIILQQIHFIQHRKLGFDKDHIVVLPVDRQMHRDYDEIKKAIARNPKVISVGGANGSPVFVAWTDGLQVNNGKDNKNITIKCIPSDLDFVKTLGIQIVEGTTFSPADQSDLDTSENYKHFRYSIMLNESAAKALGWTPAEAIGQRVEKGGPGTVKAVIKDFHFASLHEPIGPMLIFLDTQWVNRMYVKISGQDIAGTIGFLERVWKERVPYRPFEYNFLDEDYNALYKTEIRTGQIFSCFSTTAILLACLGLFALAAFTTVQRTKEIGIRKVLGATLWNIAGMLSIDFLKLVVIASLIAFPIAWWAMKQWLQNFAYRIDMSWWVFPAAAVLALVIALGTISIQAIRAGLANPVNSLRTE
jgi:putative ABC transport system permease protein